MKFAYFTECQTGDDEDYYKRYWEILREVDVAEANGWDAFGCSEQHFTPKYFTTSAPEVLYGAIATRTKKIRLYHGVVLLLHRVNHPLRVAERMAMLDIVSNGRAELGTGRGNTTRMLNAFEVPYQETRAQWEEQLEMIPKIWTQQPFSWKSKSFDIPPTYVVPRCVQKPHPPMWAATTSKEMFEITGKRGIGAMAFAVDPPEGFVEHVKTYRAAIKEAKPVGSFVNDRFAALSLTICADTGKEARELGRKPYTEWIQKAVDSYRELGRAAGKSYESHREIGETDPKLLEWDSLVDGGIVTVGDPEHCYNQLKKFQDAGVDEMILRVDGIPHEKVVRSLELLGKEVFPHLRRDPHREVAETAKAS